MKYFSVAEAEALIPELEKVFDAIMELAAKAEARAEDIRRLSQDEQRNISELAIEKSQLQFLANGMNERFQKIADLGAFPKGLDPALVDFPHRLEGKDVVLCWKLGERKITHYHGADEGFSGRKALPRSQRSAS
ncbi:MAG: DUF2203 domain-containing protein [Elusimicrobia bacterium]|nr:DUF2203 domain-containing protein [Elusimicrobiota bacterium]